MIVNPSFGSNLDAARFSLGMAQPPDLAKELSTPPLAAKASALRKSDETAKKHVSSPVRRSVKHSSSESGYDIYNSPISSSSSGGSKSEGKEQK